MKLSDTLRPIFRIAGIIFIAVLFGCSLRQSNDGMPDQVTVPLHVEGNRAFIDVTFQKPDGSRLSTRYWVDTGGGAFFITEPVARDLGLRWTMRREEGEEFGEVSVPPKAFVGNMPLELEPHRVAVAVGTKNMVPPVAPGHAEGMFPGRLLARYHVVFDYPNAKFTLARPGVLRPKGISLPMPVSKESGFARTEIDVDGITYGFLLDTGASFTIVSEVLLKSWGTKHPDWSRHPGAVGEAKTLGGSTLETMSVPSARWGKEALGEFGVTSQKEGTFERWMSSMTTSPVVGALAGNVLKRFRVELDYPNQKLYLSRP